MTFDRRHERGTTNWMYANLGGYATRIADDPVKANKSDNSDSSESSDSDANSFSSVKSKYLTLYDFY